MEHCSVLWVQYGWQCAVEFHRTQFQLCNYPTWKFSSNIEMQVQDTLPSFYRQCIQQHLFLQQRLLGQDWDGSITFIWRVRGEKEDKNDHEMLQKRRSEGKHIPKQNRGWERDIVHSRSGELLTSSYLLLIKLPFCPCCHVLKPCSSFWQ